jgi:polyhydroxybutyrate depolymerase
MLEFSFRQAQPHGTKMIRSFIFLLTLLCARQILEAAPISMTFNVGGVERRALVFPPSNPATGTKIPLVFAFHGHGGTADGFARNVGIQNAWPEALVVYPQGIPLPTDIDPKGLKPGWQRKPGEVRNRDLKFVDVMVAKPREKYSVDERHIFALGFSNGAFFTYLLWAERPQIFAGFAPVAGLPRYSGNPTVPKPAVPVGGRADKLVHIADVEQAMAMVRELNGCSGKGQPCGLGCTRYSSTKNAPIINFIHPGPHMYPPRATPIISDFFKELTNGGSTSSDSGGTSNHQMGERNDPSAKHTQSGAAIAFRKKVQNVTFPSGGLTLVGWIYKPQGDGPFPAIIWNHGSEKNPVRHPELGMFYTQHGYVLFLPIRHGHDGSPGAYIGDILKQFAAGTRDKEEVSHKAVELHEEYNKDVVAAVKWLKKQTFVDPNRIAVAGISYGGIQTLLTAEKNLGLRAAIPFAPGAMSWANKQLQEREMEAVRNAKVPLFLLQSKTDYSTGPSEVLGPIIREKGGANRAKLYPPFGTTHADGHGGFACWEEGIAIWGNDVLDFLTVTGMAASVSPAGLDNESVSVLRAIVELTAAARVIR